MAVELGDPLIDAVPAQERPLATATPGAPPLAGTARRLAIRTENVSRVYKVAKDKTHKRGEQPLLQALKDVNLEVEEGELFGLLGPNGAGKTTLIKILTTLLAPSGGVCTVDGLDVVKQSDEVRRRINMVSGGETSGFGILTVRENLWMWSQFYGVPSREANARIHELLKVVELEDKTNARVSSLSTGQRQRMNFCRGFVTDPKVLFLDEPTLGLDVHAARVVRTFTQDWMRERPDRTVLLTTHYMAEADELPCDRIAIIDHGTVLTCDTPANLKRQLQKQPIFAIRAAGLTERSVEPLGHTPGVMRVTAEPHITDNTVMFKFALEDEAAISAVVGALTALHGQILGLEKHEPTLEDVFIQLVGRSLTEAENAGA